ncbi:MAG TPA: type VI secretion system protein TssA [Salinarimonas sp.]|nr:type VI secretion system protein TssA [Salinarimonas sp.]
MSETILDLEALLAPLEAGDGAGEDPRGEISATAPYQRLRDARSDARAEERARDSQPGEDTAPPQQWRDVLRYGAECLSKRGKDFEVAAFMTEALVRMHHLAGLKAGIELLEGLLDRYWENGFPQPEPDVPDDERLEGRSAPIGGLAGEGADGTIMQPLRRMPLFRRPDGNSVSLHLWLRAEATATIDNEEKRQEMYDSGVPVMDTLRDEARVAGAMLRQVGLQARAVGALWTALDAKLQERFGSYPPATRRVSELLAKITEVAESVLGAFEEAGGGDQDAAAGPDGAAGDGAAAGGGGGGGGPRIRTRDDVIRVIEEAAEWFRKTEPHSPLAFTLSDAARRARMPLPELLEEVLSDRDARRSMLVALGIKPPEE